MHEQLKALGMALCRPADVGAENSINLRAAAAEMVVALPAGGFGYRMRDVSAEAGGVTQKSLLPLPNGETLIGRVVRQYAEAGFRRFVALVNHAGRSVEEHLRGGEPWGVEVRCSYDPQAEGSGRTGALLHAIETGVLGEEAALVVHNADCQVFRYEGSFPADLVGAHQRASRERDVLATLAAVDGTPYPFTGMRIDDGLVTDVEMYPFIPVPTHTGITVLSPGALASLREHFQRTKQNFERDMFPLWAARGRLAALVIPHTSWIAVDDRKAYRLFQQAVKGEQVSGAPD